MTRYSRRIPLLLGFCLLVVVSASRATDDISCSGTGATIGVHGTDRVMLRLSRMNTIVQICHLNQTMGTTYPITAAQCKAAYATLLTAYAMGKTVSVYLDKCADRNLVRHICSVGSSHGAVGALERVGNIMRANAIAPDARSEPQ